MESEDPASFVLPVDLQVSQGPHVEKTRPIEWPWYPWIVANQAPLSMAFHRQKYWSALLFSSPGDLPDPGIEPESPASAALAGWFFTTEQPENPYVQDEGPVSFVLNVDIQIPKDCVLKRHLFPHWMVLAPLWKVNWPYVWGFLSGLSSLYHWFVYLSVRQHHGLITVAL